MTAKGNLLTIVALVIAHPLLAGCQSPTRLDNPYGEWSTERGQIVDVKRDGTFKYCDSGICRTGKYKIDGSREVLLLDFFNMSITQRLRQLSGADEALALNMSMPMPPERRQAFDLGDGGMSPELRHSLCQDRPCRVIGRMEGDVYRFVKIRDH